MVNSVQLLGRLTKDPELVQTPTGTSIVNLSLALNRQYTTSQGEKKEETTFVDVKMFGPRAEVLNDHVAKGQRIFVEGRLNMERWQTADNQNRQRLVVIAEKFNFVDKREKVEA